MDKFYNFICYNRELIFLLKLVDTTVSVSQCILWNKTQKSLFVGIALNLRAWDIRRCITLKRAKKPFFLLSLASLCLIMWSDSGPDSTLSGIVTPFTLAAFFSISSASLTRSFAANHGIDSGSSLFIQLRCRSVSCAFHDRTKIFPGNCLKFTIVRHREN